MKIWTTILFLFVTSNILQGQNLDEILKKHFEAVGMEYLRKVQTIQFKGNFVLHYLESVGNKVPEKLLKPKFILSVEKGKGYLLQLIGEIGDISTGFFEGNYWNNQNGNVTENWNPIDVDRRIIQQELDLEGFLFDWERKGYKVTQLGNAVLKNKNHYKIRLTTHGNDTIWFYIDPKNYLISFMSFGGDLSDGKKHPSVEFQNYKKVENINIPFKRIQTELTLNGTYGEKDILISEVQINPKFESDIFKSIFKNH